MKTLKTVQKLYKLGKVLSIIFFIFSIIAFCCCIVRMLGVSFKVDTLVINGVTYGESLNENYGALDNGNQAECAMILIQMVLLAGEAVLSKFAHCYFKRELKIGTPFDVASARELMRLGILAVSIPAACSIISSIIIGIFTLAYGSSLDLNFQMNFTPYGVGIMFMVMSRICRLGALERETAKSLQNPMTTEAQVLSDQQAVKNEGCSSF